MLTLSKAVLFISILVSPTPPITQACLLWALKEATALTGLPLRVPSKKYGYIPHPRVIDKAYELIKETDGCRKS